MGLHCKTAKFDTVNSSYGNLRMTIGNNIKKVQNSLKFNTLIKKMLLSQTFFISNRIINVHYYCLNLIIIVCLVKIPIVELIHEYLAVGPISITSLKLTLRQAKSRS